MTRMQAIIAVFLMALVAIVVPSTAASGADDATSVSWALVPSDASGPDGRVSIRQQIDPGSSANGNVAVMNFSARPATFHIYANDGIVTEDGHFDLPSAEIEPRDSGRWITFRLPRGAKPSAKGGFTITLDPEETITVSFTTAVPANATPGDHPAGVVAEFVPDYGADMKVASRVGVRLHLRVAGAHRPEVGVEVIDAQWSPSLNPFTPGTMRVRAESTNTGNVRLGTHVAVQLSGPFGIAEATGTFTHREVPAGGITADVIEVPLWGLVVVNGEVALSTEAVGEDVIDAVLPTTSTNFVSWAVPYSQLALVAFLVVAWLMIVRVRRRANAHVQAQIDAAVAAATQQAQWIEL